MCIAGRHPTIVYEQRAGDCIMNRLASYEIALNIYSETEFGDLVRHLAG